MQDDLDPESPEPLYKQLAERLRERIARDGLTRLPSQRTLEQEYGVSRPTVEDALKILKDAGEVFVSQGKGTFVRRPAGLAAGVYPGMPAAAQGGPGAPAYRPGP